MSERLILRRGSPYLPYSSLRLLNKECTLYGEATITHRTERYKEHECQHSLSTTTDVETVIEPTIKLSGGGCIIIPKNKRCIVKVFCEELQPQDPTNTCVLARQSKEEMLFLPAYEFLLNLKFWTSPEKGGVPLHEYEQADIILRSIYTEQNFPTVLRVQLIISDNDEDVKRCCLRHEAKYWGKTYLYYNHKSPKAVIPFKDRHEPSCSYERLHSLLCRVIRLSAKEPTELVQFKIDQLQETAVTYLKGKAKEVAETSLKFFLASLDHLWQQYRELIKLMDTVVEFGIGNEDYFQHHNTLQGYAVRQLLMNLFKDHVLVSNSIIEKSDGKKQVIYAHTIDIRLRQMLLRQSSGSKEQQNETKRTIKMLNVFGEAITNHFCDFTKVSNEDNQQGSSDDIEPGTSYQEPHWLPQVRLRFLI